MCACADPGIFVRGGGGGPGQSDKKKSSDFFCVFLSPQLILRKSNGQFQRNLIIFQGSRGVQYFPGGGGGGGVRLLIPNDPYNL